MAVAAPVLERKVDTEESGYTREVFRDTFMTADERHNSRISSNYAKLINPETTLNDIIRKEATVRQTEEPAYSVPVATRQEKIYFVENARADADIFRADSVVNRKVVETAEASAPVEEEENEDLRPTQTTIQYKTSGLKKNSEEGKIETVKEKSAGLTKRDKIIIAVALTVIIALFALIIVNSAIISGLNGDVSALQSTLNTAESTYRQTLATKNAYFSEPNLFQIVSDFASNHGMVLR